MGSAGFAIVGAAESTRIGKVPELSSMGLALDAAANALADALVNALANAGERWRTLW